MMRGSVLIIEDEPHIVEALSFILSRDGWEVHTLTRGDGAVEEIVRIQPDLIVLDAMLPGLSGVDILRKLRGTPDGGNFLVLMLTAKGQEKNKAEALEAGANLFMAKPFSNQDILQKIRELFDK